MTSLFDQKKKRIADAIKNVSDKGELEIILKDVVGTRENLAQAIGRYHYLCNLAQRASPMLFEYINGERASIRLRFGVSTEGQLQVVLRDLEAAERQLRRKIDLL